VGVGVDVVRWRRVFLLQREGGRRMGRERAGEMGEKEQKDGTDSAKAGLSCGLYRYVNRAGWCVRLI
jgi:hypothetical protein